MFLAYWIVMSRLKLLLFYDKRRREKKKERNCYNYKITHDLHFNIIPLGRCNKYVVWSRCLFYIRLEYYGRISRYHFYH